MTRSLKSLLAAVMLIPAPAMAVELGDKTQGLAFAQKHCAECHAVEKDTVLLFTDIPSFQEVADSEGMSPRALYVFFTTSHPNMPDFVIAPDDMDNVIAYIMSLRSK